MSRHILKCAPPYFRAVWDGSKTFEVRLNDRGYQAGDDVVLREHDHWAPCTCPERDHTMDCERYTGREVSARIGHVLSTIPGRNGRQAFDGRGYVVFSLVDPARRDKEPDRPAPADVVTVEHSVVSVSPAAISMASMIKAARGGLR